MECLVMGYSARGFAECFGRSDYAKRHKYRLTSIDFFGDSDVARWGKCLSLQHDSDTVSYNVADLASLASTVQYEAIAYTSGIDNHPDIIRQVSHGKVLLGNSAEAAAAARNFETVHRFLSDNGILCPQTHYRWEGPLPPGQWLFKPVSSGGGSRIAWATPSDSLPEGHMMQEYRDGLPASAAFVANGKEAILLGLSEQLCGLGEFGARRFLYCGNIVPLSTSKFEADDSRQDSLYGQAARMATMVTKEFDLRGLNGIDFLITGDGEVLFLEINPRYCASMELYGMRNGIDLFGLHVEACHGVLPSAPPIPKQSCDDAAPYYGKAIVYAPYDIRVSNVDGWFESGIRDVPRPGEIVAAGTPLCTIFAVEPSRTECLLSLSEQQAWVLARVSRLSREGGCSSETRFTGALTT